MNTTRFSFGLLVAVVAATMISPAWADPLPGQVLKFDQQPMIATPVNGQIYFGHDELSTAWAIQPGDERYAGTAMADDFADKFDTPVVHVKWWGSYLNEGQNPDAFPLADKFLISFESDVPADATGGFSHPGVPLLSQVVTRGPLSPGSGTFDEKVIRGPDPILGESLFEYNAELHCPFPQQADTVYWLKIVALDDNPDSANPLQWGWHNRDYTLFDPLASTPPAVSPGEHVVTLFTGEEMWHFQDDAVSSAVSATILGQCDVDVVQTNYEPQRYLAPYDVPTSLHEQFSKDVAFQLYTVPEPGTALMLVGGVACLLIRSRRERRKQ